MIDLHFRISGARSRDHDLHRSNSTSTRNFQSLGGHLCRRGGKPPHKIVTVRTVGTLGVKGCSFLPSPIPCCVLYVSMQLLAADDRD